MTIRAAILQTAIQSQRRRIRGKTSAVQVAQGCLQTRCHSLLKRAFRGRCRRLTLGKCTRRLDAVGDVHNLRQVGHALNRYRVALDRLQNVRIGHAELVLRAVRTDAGVQQDGGGRLGRRHPESMLSSIVEQLLRRPRARDVVEQTGDPRSRSRAAIAARQPFGRPGHTQDVAIAIARQRGADGGAQPMQVGCPAYRLGRRR